MHGVTWRERGDGDWLASNGRWYPSSHYPRGWDTSALPPAPGHAEAKFSVTSAARRLQNLTSSGNPRPPPVYTGASDDGSGPVGASESSSAAKMWWRGEGDSPAAPVTGAADATVTSQRTHSSRLPAGAPPRRGLPPAPGRFSTDDDHDDQLDDGDLDDGDHRHDPDEMPPPAVARRVTIPPPPGSLTVAPPMPGRTMFSGASGDLGRAPGTAKRRIERAIEDAAE